MAKEKVDPVEQKGLGFFPGREDERDIMLADRIPEKAELAYTSGKRHWSNTMRLDQGSEGACVGFSWSQAYNSQPKMHYINNDTAYDIYCEATYHDDWPESNCKNSSGTSVRAGAEELLKRQMIKEYAFVYDLEQMAMWILNFGPVVIGCNWYTGMDQPSYENGYELKPSGSLRGGHAIEVDGCWWKVSGWADNWFRVLNSWGSRWGDNGRAWISQKNLQTLFNQRGAVGCTFTEKV